MKTGRNDPCPCGSGLKYKKCCALKPPQAALRPAPDIAQAMQTAVQYHQAGMLRQAEEIYRRVLQSRPDHFDALHLLGAVAHQSGRHEEAVELIGRAIAREPREPRLHFNLGVVLRALGRLDEAADCFRAAAKLKPDYEEAFNNLGSVLTELSGREQSGQELEFSGGIRIALPASLQLMTPYVLREQQDWFEDEIKFVRKLLPAGANVVDIGANYGVYTLSMAALVGETGHVWAFEPASRTAGFLARSIALNDFHNVTLIQAALSDHSGTARLGLNRNTELNSLSAGGAAGEESEEVRLLTLDQGGAEHGWRDIVFVKLDAEGEECRILDGGAEFLRRESPLIMFEVKHQNVVNLPLLHKFAELGYDSYRLVPGLDLLVSFSADKQPASFQLNLFCCKADRAEKLARAGRLVLPAGAAAAQVGALAGWRECLEALPYAAGLLPRWNGKETEPAADRARHERALELFFAAHDAARPADIRCAALQQAFAMLSALCRESPALPRLCSFARVAAEFGERLTACDAIKQALVLHAGGRFGPDEPFLAAGARFERVDPQNRMADWLLASLVEQLEKLHAFSSYYTGAASLKGLEILRNTGFHSEEMERRYRLIHERFGV